MDANGQVVELLQGIWNELKALGQNLGGRIDRTNERLDATNERLDALCVRVDQGFERLDRRIDNLLTGTHGREHGELRERLVRVEMRLGIEPGPTR